MIVANPSLLTFFPTRTLSIAPQPIPTLAVQSPTTPSVRVHGAPNSRQLILLQPLCPLFSAPVLCFQWLAASFGHNWGVGYTSLCGYLVFACCDHNMLWGEKRLAAINGHES